MSDQRQTADRRKRGRPQRGNRAADVKIEDLQTHSQRFVTVGQLSEHWNRHPYTIYRWIRCGWLKATMLGGEYQVDVSDAIAFAARQPEWINHEAS